MPQLLFFELQGQVGRGGVDRVSSSDARGSGFEPRPLHLKKYHFFTQFSRDNFLQVQEIVTFMFQGCYIEQNIDTI